MPHSRRHFIRQMACSAVGYSALFSMLGDLRKLNAATSTGGDYRALVCLFLYGGNDGNNMLVPFSSSNYSAYASARGLLALPRDSLLPLNLTAREDIDYALHPSMRELQALFHQGKATFVRNVGTLVAPLTREQYLKGGVAVPPQLFAHSDQSVLWQTSVSDQASQTGWGGRVADLLASLNGNAKVSMNMSVAGVNTFQAGQNVFQYVLSPAGLVTLDKYAPDSISDPESRAISAILARQNKNLFEDAYRTSVRSAVDNNQAITAALSAQNPLSTSFPATDLGDQLKLIARLISVRGALGHSRQIFFCALNGFDTHNTQLDTHAKSLADLSQAMSAFYSATVELGISSNVTSFTASDFGRTYSSNGKGSDHGWGNHHVVVGGAVAGGQFYGRMPTLTINGPDDTGEGRWIPTTPVEAYSATLARWFGVSDADLPLIFPNLGRFSAPNLGFMG